MALKDSDTPLQRLLKQARFDQGLTLAQCSARGSLSISYLSELEGGKRKLRTLSTDGVTKVAVCYGLEPTLVVNAVVASMRGEFHG